MRRCGPQRGEASSRFLVRKQGSEQMVGDWAELTQAGLDPLWSIWSRYPSGGAGPQRCDMSDTGQSAGLAWISGMIFL